MIVRASLARTRIRTSLAATVGAAGLALLTGCGSTSPAPPVTTVTVYSDGTTVTPGPTAVPASPAGPSSVPTVTAPSQDPSKTTPASVAPVRVGKLRGAPADFAEASSRVSKAAAADAAATSVISPSDNIFCGVIDNGAGVGCEVGTGRAPAPKATPCPSGGGATDVGRVELTAAGAMPICNSDTIRVPGAPKLAYGKRWSPPGTSFSCLSEEAGMTCVDSKHQHGLFIARETYATF